MSARGNAASEPWQLNILDCAAMMQARKLSAAELLASCMSRISKTNGGQPSFDGGPEAINAWVRLYPDVAMRAAADADQRIVEGSSPTLNGIPIGLKDVFGVAGLPVTASSRVLEGNVAVEDSAAFARINKQGVVLVGHTHAHEFANGTTSDQVGNPYDLRLSAGGSSAGSAAALAARMVPAALGTDTGGSLRTPAALCGISAIKPTRGLIPITGIIPLAPSRDTVGPMARSVADCSVLLQALTSGEAEATPLMPPPAKFGTLPVTPRLGGNPLSGIRIAITDRPERTSLHPDVAEGYRKAQTAVIELGAVIVELKSPPTLLDQDDLDLFLYPEVWAYHSEFFPRLAERYRPQVRATIERASKPYDASRYFQSQQRRAQETANWDRWFTENKIDAVLEPTLHYVARPRGEGYKANSGAGSLGAFSLPRQWNLTGNPVVTMPAGLGISTGLPVSISLVAGRGRESGLIQVAIDLQESRFPVPEPRIWQ